MKKYKIIFCLFLLPILCSCPSPVSSTRPDVPDPDNPPVIEKQELFVEAGSVRTFSTNIYEFGAGQGATYWVEEESAVPLFYDFSVEVKKLSGYSLGGYGVFFAQRNSVTEDFAALALIINNVGEYCVGLIEDKSFSYLKEWTDSAYLIKGYNQGNRLSISGLGQGEFRVSINGNEVFEFTDSSDPVLSGGGFGYLAVISPLENFPSIPVTVQFETQP